MITTVTLNPMLDKTIHVAAVRRGAIERARAMEMVVGGKGINVSRQLTHLGSPTVATGFFGGEIGVLLERLLTRERIPHDFVHIGSLTREGLTFLDAEGIQTSVFEPSAPVTAAEADKLVAHVLALARKSTWVVCSGSSPSPEGDAVFARIVQGCDACGVRTLVDSYGAPVKELVGHQPTVIKMNREEYRTTFDRSLEGESDLVGALKEFVGQGAAWAVITDGPRPAYAASTQAVWRITSPSIKAINPTGSGDSMVAGILFGLSERWPITRSLTFGAAAGVANASQWNVAASSRQQIDRCIDAICIKEL
jgi:tagatose 6-phosphate kinase